MRAEKSQNRADFCAWLGESMHLVAIRAYPPGPPCKSMGSYVTHRVENGAMDSVDS
jgi:hypothetical protein